MSENDSIDGSRDRGVLSEADREFLRDRDAYEKKRTRQARSTRLQEIKKRTRNAILDFELLLNHLEPDEVADIFEGFDDGDVGRILWPAEAQAMLAFCIVSLYDRDVEFPVEYTDQLVESAITKALEARGKELESYDHLSFNRQLSIDELQRRFLTGGALTYEQFQRLQAEGGTLDLRDDVRIRHIAGEREDVDVNVDGTPADEYFDEDSE